MVRKLLILAMALCLVGSVFAERGQDISYYNFRWITNSSGSYGVNLSNLGQVYWQINPSNGTIYNLATGDGLTGGPITAAGTIALSLSTLTNLSEGVTAFGWGNHAVAGYALQSSLLSVGNYSASAASINQNFSALQLANVSTNSRIDSINSSLVSVGNYSASASSINQNFSALQLANVSTNARIDSVNSTAVGKASPGTCTAGYVVMNTTTSGVQCTDITEALTTTYYNVTSIQTVAGTNTSSNLSLINIYDDVPYNINEDSSDLDIRANFSGVTTINQIVVRYNTSTAETHIVGLFLWDYDEGIWESYDSLGSTNGLYNIKTLGVFDSSSHVSGGLVQLRMTTTNVGASTHQWSFDWVTVSKGVATPSSVETDPFSVHTDGATPLTGDWNTGGYNITANKFIGALVGNADTVTNGIYTTTIVAAVGNWTLDKPSYTTTVGLPSAVGNYTAGKAANEVITGGWSFQPTTNVSYSGNGMVLFDLPVFFRNNVTLTQPQAAVANTSINVTDIGGVTRISLIVSGTTGNVTANNFIGALAGNAATATSATELSTYPTACAAGNYARGVNTGGNAVNCTADADTWNTTAQMISAVNGTAINITGNAGNSNMLNSQFSSYYLNILGFAAENLTSGTVAFERLPTLTNTHKLAWQNITGTPLLWNATGAIPDSNITSATTWNEKLGPTGFSAGNLTSGTVAVARLPTLNNQHTHDAANISAGTLAFARLPTLTNALTLDAANITAGTLQDARISTNYTKITGFSAANLTSGTLPNGRLGGGANFSGTTGTNISLSGGAYIMTNSSGAICILSAGATNVCTG